MHISVDEYVGAAVTKYGPFGSVCEIGSRDVNGGIRHHFGPVHYVGVDLFEGKDVDVVANFADWETDERFDCVVTTSALEHTPDARRLIYRAAQVLNPSGVLIATCAGPGWQPHSIHDGGVPRPGEWYQNISCETLADWLETAGFARWETSYNAEFADTCATAWI